MIVKLFAMYPVTIIQMPEDQQNPQSYIRYDHCLLKGNPLP